MFACESMMGGWVYWLWTVFLTDGWALLGVAWRCARCSCLWAVSGVPGFSGSMVCNFEYPNFPLAIPLYWAWLKLRLTVKGRCVKNARLLFLLVVTDWVFLVIRDYFCIIAAEYATFNPVFCRILLVSANRYQVFRDSLPDQILIQIKLSTDFQPFLKAEG